MNSAHSVAKSLGTPVDMTKIPRMLNVYLNGTLLESPLLVFSMWVQMLSRTLVAMCLGMMLSRRFSWKKRKFHINTSTSPMINVEK